MQEEVSRSQLRLEPTDTGLCAVFRFDADLAVFAGHFPGHPLVPGVYLIEAVRQVVAQRLEREVCIAEVCDARFTAPVAPGQEVRCDIELQPVPQLAEASRSWIAKARLECAGHSAAKLRLRLCAGND